MSHTVNAYALLVIDDGERVLNETYGTDEARAAALHDVLVSNHDEIDEPAPADVVAAGTEAVLEWYSGDLTFLDLDVYVDEVEIKTPAPNKLFHVVSVYPGSEVSVDSFTSEAARRTGLVERAALLDLDVDDNSDEETSVQLIEDHLGVEITLVDADLYEDDVEWHGTV